MCKKNRRREELEESRYLYQEIIPMNEFSESCSWWMISSSLVTYTNVNLLDAARLKKLGDVSFQIISRRDLL